MVRRGCCVLAGKFVLALFFVAGVAQAQDWPTRPVTMVVPYAAGGPVDSPQADAGGHSA
jgi:tripartite-type tricarboxylate transporter receptor subunit TctC